MRGERVLSKVSDTVIGSLLRRLWLVTTVGESGLTTTGPPKHSSNDLDAKMAGKKYFSLSQHRARSLTHLDRDLYHDDKTFMHILSHRCKQHG